MNTVNKIVVLDSLGVDTSVFESLAKECIVYDITAPQQVVERASGADAVFTNKTLISSGDIDTLSRGSLRYIGVLATGYNVVDVEAARRNGVAVTNVPAYSTNSVAQLTIALLLELTHHTGHHAQTVREGRWSRSTAFSYWDYPLVELSGRTLGIIGYGDIGKTVARIGSALGMKILAHRRPRNYSESSADVEVNFVEQNDLFAQSDVVSLHAPLTPETQNLIDSRRLSLMKPEAFLLNTSRGQLVVARDLADALNAGRLAGAGLDVLYPEPPNADNPLLTAKNCLITPHLGWATSAARERLMNTAVENLKAFLNAERLNRID